METNIVKILKDKPQGTKLYSSACGKCKLESVDDKSFKVSFYSSKFGFMNGGEGYLDKNGKLYDDGECVVFPSKEMRDWSKFAWKKGDVLISNDGKKEVFFNGFTDDTYALFKAKHGFEVLSNGNAIYLADEDVIATSDYTLEDNDVTQTYINTIEERLGGKLNRETLEIEKAHPKFKDGDVVTAVFTDGDEMICVFKEKIEQDYMGYCGFFSKGKHEGDVFMDLGDDCIWNDSPICKEIRLATGEEKQKLFSALEKESKAWDAEKKQIVDLKPKCEFKPFDRCIWKIRNCEGSVWQASFVSYVDEYGATPMGMSIDEDLVNLIILPYNDQTKLLLGTTDEWKGGEQ